MTRKTLTLALAFFITFPCIAAKKAKAKTTSFHVGVTDLKTERLTNPLCIDTPEPRLGWVLTSSGKDVMQTSAHVIVASSADKAERLEGDLWDTTIAGDQSQWVRYEGKELRSDTRCYWRVKVTTTKGDSDWSETASWNVGLLTESDWRGQWIGLDKAMPWDVEDVHSRLSSRYLRTEFNVEKEVKRATLYISGLGLYEAFINGKKVGNMVLTPSPTDYRKTVLYNAYDVTGMLSTKNAIGVALGNGRFYTMQQKKKPYKITNFGYPRLRANLIIEYADGKKQAIVTNDKWKMTPDGAIRSNNEYDGEIYDARKETAGWCEVGFDDTKWMDAERMGIPQGTLRGDMTPGMKVVKTIVPISIEARGDNFIVDLGQNISGWVKMKLNNIASGDSVSIAYAERRNSDGSLYRDNLRNALSTDIYIASGKEKDTWWSPVFSYHGFRYVEIKGISNLEKTDIVGEVVCDDMEETGSFMCADTILNKVYRNAVWGIRDNYKGMPVDCPQRDERQPWLGDRARGCFGEAFVFNNNALYAKWARDIAEAQREDGCIPDVAPAFWNYYSDNVTWPAALPFSLEMMLNQYGDDSPVRLFYPNVKRWMQHLKHQYGKQGLMPRDKYGDWCMPPEDITMIHSQDPKRVTDGTLIATAYYYRLNKLMEQFATRLGYGADSMAFAAEAAVVKEAFNKKYVTEKRGTSLVDGHLMYPDSTFYGNNTLTSNLLPLSFGMIDDKYIKEEVVKNIISNIMMQNNGSISCGVIGVQWLMHTLTDIGRSDMAWMLATNKKYPSWGYMAEHGATTTWELWNGDTANPRMNSGNHVMLLGDFVSWIYEDVAGIRYTTDAPGFKKIILKPAYDTDEIDSIDASYMSIYGKIVSRWHKKEGKLLWHVEVPANTTAEVHLPNGVVRNIGSGSYDFEEAVASKHSALVKNEFLYNKAPFPECHSASIAETEQGDLVATYFGGTKERNPDVCIWVSRLPKGSNSWTTPTIAADGVFKTGSDEARLAGLSGLDSTTASAGAGPCRDAAVSKHPNGYQRKACWNPVICQMPNGELIIYFKIGTSVADWTGWLVRSNDGGKTWSKREALQEGFLGPVKNKPIVSNGRIIAPTSIEKGGWRLYFEYSDDMGKTWKRSDYVVCDEGVLSIQPSIMTLSDGRLCAVARTRSEHIGITYSSDNGETWTKLRLIDTPNNNSGIDAVTLKDGRQLLVCNDKAIPKGIKGGKGLRTPLSVMLSDDGEHWKHWITLEDSPIGQYSYPSVIQTSDGHVHCVYTWRRQRIKHVELVP